MSAPTDLSDNKIGDSMWHCHLWSGGAMNCALVFSTFFSFLENLDIDEFNILWDIVHMGMINVFFFS